jgi:hypothetical protein
MKNCSHLEPLQQYWVQPRYCRCTFTSPYDKCFGPTTCYPLVKAKVKTCNLTSTIWGPVYFHRSSKLLDCGNERVAARAAKSQPNKRADNEKDDERRWQEWESSQVEQKETRRNKKETYDLWRRSCHAFFTSFHDPSQACFGRIFAPRNQKVIDNLRMVHIDQNDVKTSRNMFSMVFLLPVRLIVDLQEGTAD